MQSDDTAYPIATEENRHDTSPEGVASMLRRTGAVCFGVWPLVLVGLWSSSPALGLGYALAVHAAALYGILRSNCAMFGPVVRRFATTKKEVWLTIDDGPFPGETAAMLGVLAAHGEQATFFLEGARVAEAPALAQSIADAGHTIGNHSHRHRVATFWATGPEAARREIAECNNALSTAGVDPVGFRAPVGMANPCVHIAARRAGLPLIGWSARGFDGVDSTPDQVLRRIMPKVRPGAIILLHQRRGRDPHGVRNAAILDRLIAALHERGYRCVVPNRERFLCA